MDQDRKSTPLKSLQGRIWEAGYKAGELRSQLFSDVPRAFARWRGEQRDICIYSSGSVLAQKLLFSHAEAGDLARFIRDYFDTHIGAKRETASYQRIAASLDCPERHVRERAPWALMPGSRTAAGPEGERHQPLQSGVQRAG